MARSYRVVWSTTAEKDLQGVIDFIAANNPENALNIFWTIRRRAASLKRSPHRGRRLPEFAHLKAVSFKELVIPPWRLIYRVQKGIVEVLSLLDGRRDLEEILFERLTR